MISGSSPKKTETDRTKASNPTQAPATHKLSDILTQVSILPRTIPQKFRPNGRTEQIADDAQAKESTIKLPEVSVAKALTEMFRIGFYSAPAVFSARALSYTCLAISPVINATVYGMITGSLVAASQGEPATAVWSNLILLCKLSAVQALLGFGQSFLDNRHGQAIELATEKLSNVGRIKQELITIQMREYQNHLTRANEGKWRIDRFTDTAFQTAGNGIFLLSAIGSMTVLNWKLGLLMTVASIPTLLSDARAALVRNQTETETSQPRREFWWQRSFFSNPLYLRDLKLNHSANEMLDKVQQSLAGVQKKQLSGIVSVLKASAPASLVASLAGLGAYAYLATNVVNGTLPFTSFAIQTGILYTLQSALGKMSRSIGDIVENVTFAKHFLRLTEKVQTNTSSQTSLDLESPRNTTGIDWSQGAPEIKFDQVSFKYPDSDKWAVKDLSLVIKPGQLIGIVGDNGSGKSTLLKLLTGQLRPSSGQILLNDISLAEIGEQELWRHLGVVSQDFTVYEPMTVRDNVMMGAVERDHPLLLEDVAEQTGLDSTVAEHCPEHGLDTVLGTAFEGAVRFSGGGSQIVANTRALVGDPEILVLDEPTSAISWERQVTLLDILVQRRVTSLLTPRTRILSTHRLSFMAQADLIIELAGGTIAHQGSHDQLVDGDGFYARGFKAQIEEVVNAGVRPRC